MSLLFAPDSAETVTHGSATELDDLNVGTIIAWGNLVNLPSGSASANCTILNKTGAVGTIVFRVTGADELQVFCDRATTNLQVSADVVTGFPTAFGADEHLSFAGVWDLAAGDSSQKLFMGNEDTPIAEATTYASQVAGSGSKDSDASGDLTAWRGFTDVTAFDGHGAFIGLWDRVLTLGEIEQQQFRPHPTPGLLLMTFYGWDGTAEQRDYSGHGNNGTVVGAALSSVSPGIVPGWMSSPPPVPFGVVDQCFRPTADVRIGDWKDDVGGSVDLYTRVDEVAPSGADHVESGAS